MEILIATNNLGKKKEMLSIMKSIKGFSFVDLSHFPEVEEPEETSTSFEGNALLKAEYYSQKFNIPTISEDSGFRVSAFPEKFGVHTKRQFQAQDDIDWLTQFLDLLDPVSDRNATFYSSMGFVDPQTSFKETCIASIEGTMEKFPQTPIEKGIPVAAVFVPQGSSQVISAMDKETRKTKTHRGQCTQKMLKILEKYKQSLE